MKQMKTKITCAILTLASITISFCAEVKWQPEGCPIAIPFPSKPLEKTVDIGEGESVAVAYIHLNVNASIKASFNNIDVSSISKDSQFDKMQILADNSVQSMGLSGPQYEKQTVPLGNRLTVRATKSMSVNSETKKVQFLIDVYFLSRGVLYITVVNNFDTPSFEAMKFRNDIANLKDR
jgi:hypothetical protein